ncbi:MAG: DUF3426 domain-containing protein [Pseudomonadota bacterium]|nr:DUF3426 domain-containing protein [Pseudomonadota bacterium]
MYTQCPECLSVFSLDAQTLAKANGHVVCGHCAAGFDSLATLAEQLPPEPFTELPLNEPSLEPPRVDLVVYRPQPESPAVVEIGASNATHSHEDFSTLVFAPRFARESRRARKRESARQPERRGKPRTSGERHWPWVIACALLLLLFGAQLAWAKREMLIRDPLVGHGWQATCAVLGCELPLVSAPKQLRLLASNVQAHPSAGHALMISASVRNDAHFTQPYPLLTITLSDAQGKRLGMRRLQPREYLDDDNVLQRGLAPGASAVLVLEIEDPGDRAVAFEINFE